jgi:hypothetical protein
MTIQSVRAPGSLIPTMTSATTPSGVASAESVYSAGVEGWRPFNPWLNIGGWLCVESHMPTWLQYQFAAPTRVTHYEFIPWRADSFPNRGPSTWQFQGSNNGSSWTTLDSQSGFYPHRGVGPYLWSIAEPQAFTYYRIYITANVGANAFTGIASFRMYNSGILNKNRTPSSYGVPTATAKTASYYSPSNAYGPLSSQPFVNLGWDLSVSLPSWSRLSISVDCGNANVSINDLAVLDIAIDGVQQWIGQPGYTPGGTGLASRFENGGHSQIVFTWPTPFALSPGKHTISLLGQILGSGYFGTANTGRYIRWSATPLDVPTLPVPGLLGAKRLPSASMRDASTNMTTNASSGYGATNGVPSNYQVFQPLLAAWDLYLTTSGRVQLDAFVGNNMGGIGDISYADLAYDGVRLGSTLEGLGQRTEVGGGRGLIHAVATTPPLPYGRHRFQILGSTRMGVVANWGITSYADQYVSFSAKTIR